MRDGLHRGARARAALGVVGALLVGSGALRVPAASGAPAPAPAPLLGAAPDAVVARVGERAISARALEARIGSLMPWQLKPLGTSPEGVKRRVLEEGLVRDAVLSMGAEAEGLGQRAEVSDRIRGVLRNALLTRLRAQLGERGVSEQEARAYYELHREKYAAPQKLSLQRILVATKPEAQALIDELSKNLDPKRFSDLARDKSLDKITHMRGGNLGLVSADGSTSEPGVRIDPLVVTAAFEVKDGELVPRPVAEEGQWAVVWRRQSTKPVERPFELEVGNIKQTISMERLEKEIASLLDELRRDRLRDLRLELADSIEITPASDLQPARRPGGLPPPRRAQQPAAAPPAPTAGPGGLR